MKKITIEYHESDSYNMVISRTKDAINGSLRHLNLDNNIKIKFDEGLESGCITQRGVCVPFLAIRR